MWLLERARAIDFAPGNPVTVIPCELVEQNGDRLREIVMILGDRWSVGDEFQKWLDSSVVFCNTLVDRIVPGKPGNEKLAELETQLGYRDELLTVCEPYRLFVVGHRQADLHESGRQRARVPSDRVRIVELIVADPHFDGGEPLAVFVAAIDRTE